MPASVGDRVWLDTNGNGLQDDGEPGVPGVTVELRQGSALVGSTTTTDSGFYSFPTVAPGTYFVVFRRPNGVEFTVPLAGNPTGETNSKVIDAVTGATGAFSVSAGQRITNIDAGLVAGVC